MKKRIISIDISIGTLSELMGEILEKARKNISSYVCVANVHMLVEAHNSLTFANVVNSADIVTADGMPLAKALYTLHGLKQDRVTGLSILHFLLKESTNQNIKIGFYGGTNEIQHLCKEYIDSNYPNLNVVFYKEHPFRELSLEEENELAKDFNNSGVQLLFVASGCPRQEKWMFKQKGKIDACMIGIGGALSILIGLKKNAPEWMQKNSLEWLFRLSQEPVRLFKRYASSNTIFMWLMAKQILNNNKRSN